MNTFDFIKKIKDSYKKEIAFEELNEILKLFLNQLVEAINNNDSVVIDETFQVYPDYIKINENKYNLESSLIWGKSRSKRISRIRRGSGPEVVVAPIPRIKGKDIHTPIPRVQPYSSLIDTISQEFGLPKSDISKTLDAFVTTANKSLKEGNGLLLEGFGSFAVSERSARTSRNPKTGKEISIPAKKIIKFYPSKGDTPKL